MRRDAIPVDRNLSSHPSSSERASTAGCPARPFHRSSFAWAAAILSARRSVSGPPTSSSASTSPMPKRDEVSAASSRSRLTRIVRPVAERVPSKRPTARRSASSGSTSVNEADSDADCSNRLRAPSRSLCTAQLGDRHNVQHRVVPTVATAVDAMAHRLLVDSSRRRRHQRAALKRAAPCREPPRITDLDEQPGGATCRGPGEVLKRRPLALTSLASSGVIHARGTSSCVIASA
jgi:hypothetical protein